MSGSGAMTDAKIDLRNRCRKAQYKLQSLLYNTNIKKSIALKLYDQLVKPIACYGCEYWGVMVKYKPPDLYKYDELPQEKFHLAFMRFILGTNRYASNLAVRGELERFPLYISINRQIVKYLKRLESRKCGRLLQEAYNEQQKLAGSLKI